MKIDRRPVEQYYDTLELETAIYYYDPKEQKWFTLTEDYERVFQTTEHSKQLSNCYNLLKNGLTLYNEVFANSSSRSAGGVWNINGDYNIPPGPLRTELFKELEKRYQEQFRKNVNVEFALGHLEDFTNLQLSCIRDKAIRIIEQRKNLVLK